MTNAQNHWRKFNPSVLYSVYITLTIVLRTIQEFPLHKETEIQTTGRPECRFFIYLFASMNDCYAMISMTLINVDMVLVLFLRFNDFQNIFDFVDYFGIKPIEHRVSNIILVLIWTHGICVNLFWERLNIKIATVVFNLTIKTYKSKQ